MPIVRLTAAARRDLRGIWDYLAREASPDLADETVRRIQKTASGLAFMPLSAQARPDLGPEVRSRRVSSYTIYYRSLSNGIEVGRVLHGRRNVTPEMLQ
jgi:toxin ParE1/3/4